MYRALGFAERAQGRSSPNPPVGAVVVLDGEIVGEGHTQPVGSWHAEVEALHHARERARGATLYVTLEPCCHFGRTPPCTDAVLAAGVRKVVIAVQDPNPKVLGGGIAILRDAGIEVEIGDGAAAAHDLLAGFESWIRTGLPLVTAKFAASLDGRIAGPYGGGRITGKIASAEVHRRRNRLDAIIVGVGTVLTDDPRLTARPDDRYPADGKQPLRVIVDSTLRTPLTARLFREPGATLVAYASGDPQALTATGAELVRIPGGDGRVDLSALIKDLGARGCLNVQIEGGSTMLGAAFDAGLVDRVEAYIAPIILGGLSIPAVSGSGTTPEAPWRIQNPTILPLGDDLLIAGPVQKSEVSNV